MPTAKRRRDDATDDDRTSGPEPDRLKIDRPWADAVSDALKKRPPAGGWPSEPETQPKKRTTKKGRGK